MRLIAPLIHADLFASCVWPSVNRSVTNHPTGFSGRFGTLPLSAGAFVSRFWSGTSGLRLLIADSPACLAESCSPGLLSHSPCYGPVVHLLLLSTSPRGDAVAVGYGPENVCPERTCTSLTYTLTNALPRASRPCPPNNKPPQPATALIALPTFAGTWLNFEFFYR